MSYETVTKPTVIYISGAPGSGKTTLSKLLSEQLYIPYISSDIVHGGLEFTQKNHDRGAAIELVFVPLLIDYAQKGTSFIVDHVLQKEIAKATIINKLENYANIIYIHTQSSHPIERYINRVESSELPDIIRRRELLLERAKHHQDNLINTQDPIDLNVPTLVVNTDSGYSPGLDEVIDFINKHRSASR